MKQDVIEIEILEDGTIKTSTDRVSMANHQNAEGFLRSMSTLAGGMWKQVRKIGARLAHGHSHEHGHEHGHTHSH